MPSTASATPQAWFSSAPASRPRRDWRTSRAASSAPPIAAVNRNGQGNMAGKWLIRSLSSLSLNFAALVLAVSTPLFAATTPNNSASATIEHTQLAAAPSPPGKASAEVEKALNTSAHIAIQDEHLTRILEFLSWDMSVNFIVDYRVVQPPWISIPGAPEEEAVLNETPAEELGYVTDGMVPYIRLEDVALRDVLNALCRPLKLSFVPCPEYVWISTEEMIAKTDFTDPPDEADAEIAKRLTSQIDIEFKDVHITQILEFVGEYTDVNIVIDKNAVLPPLKAQGHKPLGKDGYQLTGQVPYIWLKDVSLKESLKALLLPLNLTYKVEPGRIYVTSAKNKNAR